MPEPATFRSRARVVDLLGRQQIADAPTAMGELFKNALDAAATDVRVNFDEENQLLQIRDNGLGMRPCDVKDKWLVLATESRFQPDSEDSDNWLKHATSEQKEWLNKPKYGEKGIGRLSIALLGRMTLLWTVWGKGVDKVGTLCLVHWNLFQHPHLLFEDIPVPILKLQGSPSLSDFEYLFTTLQKNAAIQGILKDTEWDISPDKHLSKELQEDINIDCTALRQLIDLPWETGTSFIVFNPSEHVEELFEKDNNEIKSWEDRTADWLKSYHAFSTFWNPFHETKDRSFQIHPSLNDKPLDKSYRYWEPDDFKLCDHHIKIEVSKDGFAKGFFKNYNDKKTTPYQKQLKNLPKSHHSPGNFLVEIGYIQGQKSDSFLPEIVRNEMETRLKHAGGFSIYMDNVRIQPYGAIDSDFAGFETRRAKNAGRYYFSSVRMFGGVFIPNKTATGLKEKAGREGFVKNGASRGLRLWLEDLFTDLADSHFGSKSDRKDKKERKEKKAREAAQNRLAEETAEYLKSIKIYKAWIKEFEQREKDQVRKGRQHIAAERNAVAGTHIDDCEESIDKLRELENELRDSPCDPPDGAILEGDILDDVDTYIGTRERILNRLKKEITNQVAQLAPLLERARSEEDNIKNLSERLNSKSSYIHNSLHKELQPAIAKAKTIEGDIQDFADKEIAFINRIRDEALDGLTLEKIARDKSGESSKIFEKAIQLQTDTYDEVVLPRVRRLVNDFEHLTDNSSKSILLNELSKKIESLQERLDYLTEIALIGLILETATHEYENQVSLVRNSIRSLKRKLHNGEAETLAVLADAFEIIDHRIRMFDPIVRRRSPNRSSLSGKSIKDFILHHAKLTPDIHSKIEFTAAFCELQLHKVKTPVILGSIFNLFTNALYWTNKGNSKGRIRFSVVGNTIVVSDDGPGITKNDRERIFDPGFSRRPYGRGLGLFIAKEALRGADFILACSQEPELGALDGANFTITPFLNND
ncbi:Signal transduction histidine kinase [Rubritalea squalenifaciens DSM 18772]|uniref:Signal transduction histidine kinase n=1 Tax=Rubritalea squalenifaciens DSM 18772 TaxID=1123071 RepID=A0A1M6C664_9BACT|nr:ATP-binding protein [Rubritalea squalenifaciens]SHI56537.1 Signal transduction histidine kinase [Rubritalea squalenifaciens DSM 18772]